MSTNTNPLAQLNLNVGAFRNTVCLQLSLKTWGNRRSLPKNIVIGIAVEMARKEAESKGISNDDDILKLQEEWEKRLSSTTKLVVCDELSAIEDFQNLAKKQALALQIPKTRPSKAKRQKQKDLNDGEAEEMVLDYDTIPEGFYLYTMDAAAKVDAMLRDNLATLKDELIPSLAAVWDEKVEIAKAALTRMGTWQEGMCPRMEKLRHEWSIKWRWISFNVPEGLPPELREIEQKRQAEAMARQAEEIVLALRESFLELISSTADILRVQDGQRKRKLYDGRIDDVKQFIAAFNDRNIFDDAELASLVEKAREIMVGVEKDKLTKDIDQRNRIADTFNDIKESLSNMVVSTGIRAIKFEE